MPQQPGPIVVLEDDADVRQLLHDVLEIEGYVVIGVPHPDLVSKLLSRDPALILVDLMLPHMSGIEVATQVRQVDGEVPLVALSASRVLLELASKSGLFQAVLAKPFDLATLLELIQRHALHDCLATR